MKKTLSSLGCVFLLAALSGCADVNYEKGKSSADVPSRINTIWLKNVYMAKSFSSDKTDGEPQEDTAPSQNDQDVMRVVKATILNQFANYGYSIVEQDNGRADVAVKYYVKYQPERWPLVDRSIWVGGRAYNNEGDPLFNVEKQAVNSTGLIGAIIGPDQDEFVAAPTREAVIALVKELRRGTNEHAVGQHRAKH